MPWIGSEWRDSRSRFPPQSKSELLEACFLLPSSRDTATAPQPHCCIHGEILEQRREGIHCDSNVRTSTRATSTTTPLVIRLTGTAKNSETLSSLGTGYNTRADPPVYATAGNCDDISGRFRRTLAVEPVKGPLRLSGYWRARAAAPACRSMRACGKRI